MTETYQETLDLFVTRMINDLGPYGVLLLLALLPALCEETLCRGFLLAGLRAHGRLALAVGASAILFGILHLDPSRLLTTTLLGALLAVVVLRSGSLFPAITLHLLNNAFVVAAHPQYGELHPDAVPRRLFEASRDVLPGALAESTPTLAGLTVATVCLVVGIGLLKPRRRPTPFSATPSAASTSPRRAEPTTVHPGG